MVKKRMYRTHVFGEVENAALILEPMREIQLNSIHAIHEHRCNNQIHAFFTLFDCQSLTHPTICDLLFLSITLLQQASPKPLC